ncbi:hypothetical protein [Amycolatopsis sp. FDAARGOS 1241]|uniref:hypothetical protein n=1 Tax=Amycolatopsis sp. FDAARGOS 1241 TaxID=2778070 RepID=UPI00194F91E1|nr:hypothetical protein [Amycolatopsis sp. FDAARGOS 1241]QRP48521.1 hypothetical protein I6J71_12140 [Amycolatopsis sp. FDAARGOS 1241]
MTEGVAPRVNGKAVVKDPPLVARIDRLMLATVLVHFPITSAHAALHLGAGVVLDVAQLAFVVVVIIALPVYAIYRHRGTAGAVLLVGSMAASFLFGFFFHFFSDTGDNIAHVHGGSAMPFSVTALVPAVVELFGTVLAAAVLRRRVRIS